jgi:cytochrome c551/c552
MKSVLRIFAILGLASSLAHAAPDGAQLFANNCAACHQLDQMVVGPSLAEIRGIYQGKPDDFVKWCVAPQRKRQGAIEMPSMVHVGDEGLRAIYAHVMKVAEGVTVKKQQQGDPFAASHVMTKWPQVQRIFMPDSGPASIAVAVDAQHSLCWDAGACRLRYMWTGGFIDGYPYWKGNGSSLATLVGQVRYTEAESPFGADKKVKFLGYTMKQDRPTFHYQVGEMRVSESFSAAADGKGIVRKISLDPTPASDLVLHFPAPQNGTIKTESGQWREGKLTVRPEQASSIVLHYSFP